MADAKNQFTNIDIIKQSADKSKRENHSGIDTSTIQSSIMRLDLHTDHVYYTEEGNGKTAKNTPESILAHELTHRANERAGAVGDINAYRGKGLSVDERSYVLSSASNMSAVVKDIEEPAIKATNILCEKLFGSEACGPKRLNYDFPPENIKSPEKANKVPSEPHTNVEKQLQPGLAALTTASNLFLKEQSGLSLLDQRSIQSIVAKAMAELNANDQDISVAININQKNTIYNNEAET
ncbi:MAG: hypothetical protein HOO85_06845 [Methylotenera sp.]|nr:hypothetical protein [Methylotenera sp.]